MIEQYISVYEEGFQEPIVKCIDDEYSAGTPKRREMKLPIKDISDGRICKVVIRNLDRLSRSVTDWTTVNKVDTKKFSNCCFC